MGRWKVYRSPFRTSGFEPWVARLIANDFPPDYRSHLGTFATWREAYDHAYREARR